MTTRTLIALALLSGCAATNAAPAPVTPAPAAAPLVLRIEPALPTLTLSCHGIEDTTPNGLDDDCDGSIDHLPKASALTVTWTSAPGSEVDVWLRDEAGNVVGASQEAHVSGCASEAAATSARVFTNPPAGPAQLVIMAKPCTSPGTDAANVPVVLSLGDPAGSHAYLLSLTPGQVIPVAAYVAP